MNDLNLADLTTEARNPRTTKIDQISTLEMVTVINQEDQSVPQAVAKELPQIARAIDEIAARFERGGRLFYIGAGTSGRLGVLDASECPPTFSVPPTLVQGLIAGGDSALRKSSEKSEDSREQGAADLMAAGFGLRSSDASETPDTLVGIAASGRTPYVLGAMEQAKKLGALVISLTCVAGSMVNVQPTNEKLVDRAQRIIAEATGVDRTAAAKLLQEAGSVKVAIAMQKLGLDRAQAETKLKAAAGSLARALA